MSVPTDFESPEALLVEFNPTIGDAEIFFTEGNKENEDSIFCSNWKAFVTFVCFCESSLTRSPGLLLAVAVARQRPEHILATQASFNGHGPLARPSLQGC